MLHPFSSFGPHRPHRQTGATMIEVLVAVLVLAIGLLGVAGLQLNGLKANQSAMQRSAAVVLSYSIGDAMRANRDAATAGAYNAAFCATGQADLSKWDEALKASLSPDACGQVSCNAEGLCEVHIRWDDSRAGGQSAQLLTTQVQL